jgi:hypothetical protein
VEARDAAGNVARRGPFPLWVQPDETQITLDEYGRRGTIGGFIELSASPPRAGMWTTVQVQDPQGRWQDLTGWRAGFNREGTVLWWVREDDLGAGPFRWLVYERPGTRLLALSEPFALPARNRQRVQVQLSLTR